MINNILEKNGLTFNTELTFKDANSIIGWATSSVEANVEAGIIQGYKDNTFKPKAEITRAEAAVMIYRLLDTLNK